MVLAAESIFDISIVHTGPRKDWKGNDVIGYNIDFVTTKEIPLGEFAEKWQHIDESIAVRYDTWQELQEDMGYDLLENPVLVNNVRGVQGYTGYYKGVKVSVMASGMGMPAIGIYSHELFNFFGVENIIRVGSAGSIQEHINLYDLVIAQGACTDSNWASQFHLPGTFAPIASWELLSEAVKAAEANGATYHVGNVNSSDVFYGDHVGVPEGLDSIYGLKKMGVMALEMEAAALYMNAARYGKRGLCICTISDHVIKHEETTAAERQTAFTTMMKVALDVAVAMESK